MPTLDEQYKRLLKGNKSNYCNWTCKTLQILIYALTSGWHGLKAPQARWKIRSGQKWPKFRHRLVSPPNQSGMTDFPGFCCKTNQTERSRTVLYKEYRPRTNSGREISGYEIGWTFGRVGWHRNSIRKFGRWIRAILYIVNVDILY